MLREKVLRVSQHFLQTGQPVRVQQFRGVGSDQSAMDSRTDESFVQTNSGDVELLRCTPILLLRNETAS